MKNSFVDNYIIPFLRQFKKVLDTTTAPQVLSTIGKSFIFYGRYLSAVPVGAKMMVVGAALQTPLTEVSLNAISVAIDSFIDILSGMDFPEPLTPEELKKELEMIYEFYKKELGENSEDALSTKNQLDQLDQLDQLKEDYPELFEKDNERGNASEEGPFGNAGDIPAPAPVDPIILDLNRNGKIDASDETNFDMTDNGFKEKTSWASDGDGFLVLDRNGDGVINDASELFGDSNGTKHEIYTPSLFLSAA